MRMICTLFLAACFLAASVNGIQMSPEAVESVAEIEVGNESIGGYRSHLRGLLSAAQEPEEIEEESGDESGFYDVLGAREEEFPEVEDDQPAPGGSGPPIPPPLPDTDDSCDDNSSSTKICIDFSHTPKGYKLQHGDYIKHEWLEAYGMNITAKARREGSTPDGMARIYDSSTNNGRDSGLQSPNQYCSPPGPGKGEGGRPGARGENCEPQGNIVIIQNKSDEESPDDNKYGGSITFEFECALEKLLSLGLLDIQNQESSVGISTTGAKDPITRKIDGFGDNSIQSEQFYDMKDVSSVTLSLATGGVRYICFCLDLDKCHKARTSPPPPPPPPTANPPKQSTAVLLDPKQVVKWSVKNNWDEDGTFNEGKGSRFFPPKGTDLGHLLPEPKLSTLYPFAVDEAYFFTLVRLAMASWQSVANFQMLQVESGGDVVLEAVSNAYVYTNGRVPMGASAYAPGSLKHGGRIVYCLYRRTSVYTEEEYKDYTETNLVYALTLHEFGHLVGLHHKFIDSGDYVPDPIFNTVVMDYKSEAMDGKIKRYLTQMDIDRAQAIWGPSDYQPLISLKIHAHPNIYYVRHPIKHYVTTSFDEANTLVKCLYATDVLWIYGVISKTDAPYRRPLYRSYNGVLGHRYSVDSPVARQCRIACPVGCPERCFEFFNEGPIGYIWRYPYKNLSPLYRYYNEYIDDEILDDRSEVHQYTNRTLLGYFIGFDAMVGFVDEQSYF